MNHYPKIVLAGLVALLSLSASAQKSIKNYINKYDSLAMAKSQQYGIPVSIILGVSIVESGAGQSLICRSLNNFFGIKGKNRSSEKKMGYKSAYKEYASAEESFEHFCKVLVNKKFYRKLKGTTNYKEWLNQMNKASYASAKQRWIDDITKNIKKYELYKFDDTEKATAVLNN